MTRSLALDPAPSPAYLLCGSVGHSVSICLNYPLLKAETEMVPGVKGGVGSA